MSQDPISDTLRCIIMRLGGDEGIIDGIRWYEQWKLGLFPKEVNINMRKEFILLNNELDTVGIWHPKFIKTSEDAKSLKNECQKRLKERIKIEEFRRQENVEEEFSKTK